MKLQRDVNIKFGNHKLPTTTAIFNITSAKDCPSRKKGMCQAILNGRCICYALRAEIQYPQVTPYRRKQEKVWDKLTAREFTRQFLNVVARRRIRTTALRLNESGDFRSQADVRKASRIADYLKPHGIVVYCYTARKDLKFKNISTNLKIHGSGFRVTGEFRFIKDIKDKPKEFGICPGNCRYCTRCLHGLDTVILPH